MRLTVILVPFLVIVAGVVTYLVVPLDPRLKAMLFAADVFAAIALGLLLWRQGK